jgi:aryl-alcohol dehydrogenase-like predicted oxidoreductase
VKYRKLGRTDLELSEVGFGVWTVSTGWWGKIEPADGEKLLQQALELGVTFFDTADTYGLGVGEEILAKAFHDHRHEIVIGTKFGYDWYTNQERTGHQERPQKWEPDFIRYACEQSLRRLQTDYIDLYQLHNPRLDTIQRDEIFETLDDLVREGKLRHYGIAIGPDIGWEDEGMASMQERDIESLQIIYSALEQQPARNFFPAAEKANTGLLSRVPHASEVLTDDFVAKKPSFDADDHRAHRRQQWLESAMKKREQVVFMASETGRTLSQAAIQFCLSEPSIASVLPNIVRLDQLAELAASSETPPLENDELEYLRERFDENFGLERLPEETLRSSR